MFRKSHAEEALRLGYIARARGESMWLEPTEETARRTGLVIGFSITPPKLAGSSIESLVRSQEAYEIERRKKEEQKKAARGEFIYRRRSPIMAAALIAACMMPFSYSRR